jgi:hypothetical protein
MRQARQKSYTSGAIREVESGQVKARLVFDLQPA